MGAQPPEGRNHATHIRLVEPTRKIGSPHHCRLPLHDPRESSQKEGRRTSTSAL